MDTQRIHVKIDEHSKEIEGIHQFKHDFNLQLREIITSLGKVTDVLQGSLGRAGIIDDIKNLKESASANATDFNKRVSELEKRIYAAGACVTVVVFVFELWIKSKG